MSVVLAAEGGIDAVSARERYPQIAELPFDAACKLMATFHQMKDASGRQVIRCFVKGAPDQLLARAVTVAGVGVGPAAFEPRRPAPMATGLELLALAGIVDPPRRTAKASVATAAKVGIRVRMITGDHAVTATAAVGQLGIDGTVLSGTEFAAMSEEEALARIDDIGAIGRVSPEHVAAPVGPATPPRRWRARCRRPRCRSGRHCRSRPWPPRRPARRGWPPARCWPR